MYDDLIDESQLQFENRKRERTALFLKSYKVNLLPKQLSKMLRNSYYQELRGLFWNNDLYWWDASLGTHFDAYRWFGINIPDRINLDVELHLDREDNGIFLTTKTDETLEAVLKHYTLINAFDSVGNLIEK